MKLVISALLTLLLSSIPIHPQAFPWGDFARRSLANIVQIDEREIAASEKRPSVIAHADKLLSAVRVKYTGKSRPISEAKMEVFKKYWLPLFARDSPAYADLYENDFLFLENGVEYWLPVQKRVSSYFAKELSAGDEIDVYLVRAGGICEKRKCDWLFLVEEFRRLPTAASTTTTPATKN
jgi:hypothetical protein